MTIESKAEAPLDNEILGPFNKMSELLSTTLNDIHIHLKFKLITVLMSFIANVESYRGTLSSKMLHYLPTLLETTNDEELREDILSILQEIVYGFGIESISDITQDFLGPYIKLSEESNQLTVETSTSSNILKKDSTCTLERMKRNLNLKGLQRKNFYELVFSLDVNFMYEFHESDGVEEGKEEEENDHFQILYMNSAHAIRRISQRSSEPGGDLDFLKRALKS